MPSYVLMPSNLFLLPRQVALLLSPFPCWLVDALLSQSGLPLPASPHTNHFCMGNRVHLLDPLRTPLNFNTESFFHVPSCSLIYICLLVWDCHIGWHIQLDHKVPVGRDYMLVIFLFPASDIQLMLAEWLNEKKKRLLVVISNPQLD